MIEWILFSGVLLGDSDGIVSVEEYHKYCVRRGLFERRSNPSIAMMFSRGIY